MLSDETVEIGENEDLELGERDLRVGEIGVRGTINIFGDNLFC